MFEIPTATAEPRPSSPLLLLPQATSEPFDSAAMHASMPHERNDTRAPMATDGTAEGAMSVYTSVALPSPSWPSVSMPQQCTVRDEAYSTHVKPFPAVT